MAALDLPPKACEFGSCSCFSSNKPAAASYQLLLWRCRLPRPFLPAERHGGREDVERTFCCATGSYRRGAADSSDIDILICLPPSLAGADCGAFLSEVGQAERSGVAGNESCGLTAIGLHVLHGACARLLGPCREQPTPLLLPGDQPLLRLAVASCEKVGCCSGVLGQPAVQ